MDSFAVRHFGGIDLSMEVDFSAEFPCRVKGRVDSFRRLVFCLLFYVIEQSDESLRLYLRCENTS